MTRLQILKIRFQTKLLYHNIPARHKQELAEARATLDKLQKDCDHKHPDGSSAWVDGFAIAFCDICHENDF